MTLSDTTLEVLRTDLVSSIDAHNRGRSRRRMIAVVPVLALIGAAGLVLSSGDDTAAYALTARADGTIRVQVFPDFDDVEDLQASLAEQGLQTAVVQIRSHPSLEGVVEVVSHSNKATGALEFDNGEFVIDVAAAAGEIEILIYSPTKEGDTYQAAPSVFAPGQEFAGLHCAYPDRPLTTPDFEDRASEAGIDNIRWTVFGDIDPDNGSIDAEEFDERPEGVITGAQMSDPEKMLVFVDSDGSRPAADTIGMNDGTHYREVPACTSELAARWE